MKLGRLTLIGAWSLCISLANFTSLMRVQLFSLESFLFALFISMLAGFLVADLKKAIKLCFLSLSVSLLITFACLTAPAFLEVVEKSVMIPFAFRMVALSVLPMGTSCLLGCTVGAFISEVT